MIFDLRPLFQRTAREVRRRQEPELSEAEFRQAWVAWHTGPQSQTGSVEQRLHSLMEFVIALREVERLAEMRRHEPFAQDLTADLIPIGTLDIVPEEDA